MKLYLYYELNKKCFEINEFDKNSVSFLVYLIIEIISNKMAKMYVSSLILI